MTYAKDKKEYISYVLGKLETYAEGYAASSGIPFTELAGIISGFFHSKAGGELLGNSNSLPALPEQRRGVGRPRKEGRPAMAALEIPSSTHGGMWSPQAKARLSASMKKVWRKRQAASKKPLHWTQTPEGRKRSAERMRKYWKEGKFAGVPKSK